MLAWAAPVVAGVWGGNGEIGLDLGLTRFDSNFTDESATRLSFRVGRHNRSRRFGSFLLVQWEVQVGRATASEELLPGEDKETETTFLLLNGLVNFHVRTELILPYVLVGVGAARFNLDALGLSTESTRAALQIAFGSRFFFRRGGRTAIRVEVSQIHTDVFDESTRFPTFAAGVTWRLGGGR